MEKFNLVVDAMNNGPMKKMEDWVHEDFLFFNYLNIDMSKIKCLIDERSEEDEIRGVEEYSGSKNKYFFHLKRFNRESTISINFDLALIGDLIPEQLNGFFPFKKINNIEFLDPFKNKFEVKGYIKPNYYNELYKDLKSRTFTALNNNLNPKILKALKRIKNIQLSR